MEIRTARCRGAISPSRLPGLKWAVNPYRGCQHGCLYCYAQEVARFEMSRPWGEVVEVKSNFPAVLKRELAKGASGVYGIGTVTDPYQPVEKRFEITRACLASLRRARAKISILTKSDLVLRDIDLLEDYEEAEVGVSIGVIDENAAGILEPGAPRPFRRFEVLRQLTSSGVRSYLMAAPIISGISDSVESIRLMVGSAESAGVRTIMWDRFNPKPMLVRRMRQHAADLVPGARIDSGDWSRVRAVLREECTERGIQLLDAF